MTSNEFDMNKYKQVHNSMYNKFRILNLERFSTNKNSNPIRYNTCQNFTDESHHSKVIESSEYLTAQKEENKNRDNNQYHNIITEPGINSNFNFNVKNNDGKYIPDNNKVSNEEEENMNEKRINDNYDNERNIFEKQNEENNRIYNTSTYRKITTNKYGLNSDENQNDEKDKLSSNIKTKIINFDIFRNKKKEKALAQKDELIYDNNTYNFEETKKIPLSKNSSLNEYLNISTNTISNLVNINNPFDEVTHNKHIFYKSNIFDNFDNSKIMDIKFLDGIKNQQRKTSLLKAMEKYNRFKFMGKLVLNNNTNENSVNNENEKFKNDKTVKEENNNNNEEEIKNEKINTDINEDEAENENEFSFNSEFRKNVEKNHLKEIIVNNNEPGEKINNNIDNNVNENETNVKKEEIVNTNDNLLENIGTNISYDENTIENKELRNEEVLNNKSNFKKEEKTEKILEDKELEDHTRDQEEKLNQKEDISKQKESIEEKEKINKKVDSEENMIVVKEESEKIIKPKINIPLENIEYSKKEKIIPEINISSNEKDLTQENKADNNNNNNNIINNSINININNNEAPQKNDMMEQKQYIQLNNIKYINNSKPGYFVRKVIREEHYYIDENGKEKILQVKQEFINNEDKKKIITNNPFKKKYINIRKKIYYNNSNKSADKNTLNSSYEKKDNFEKIEKIEIDADKHNGSFEAKSNIKDTLFSQENKNIENSSTKCLENEPGKIIEKIIKLKKPIVNDNLSNLINTLVESNINNNSFKTLESDENTNYNKIKNNNSSIYKRRNKEKKNIKVSNNQKINSNIIKVNSPKNFETKTRLLKPIAKKDNLPYFIPASSEIKKISTIKPKNKSIKMILDKSDKVKNDPANIQKIIINTLSNSLGNKYIKVNKTDKYKSPNTEVSHKLKLNSNSNLNSFSLCNTNTYASIRKNPRESSKNHTYHEINSTTTKNNNKLASNSWSNYFNESSEELNNSINKNTFQKNSNKSYNNFDSKYSVNINKINNILYKDKNLEMRTQRYHRNLGNINILNNSVNKDHHRYYESKSIKKVNNINNHNKYSLTKNLDIINRNENKNIKEYFYSYYDTNNYNQSAKKINRTIAY